MKSTVNRRAVDKYFITLGNDVAPRCRHATDEALLELLRKTGEIDRVLEAFGGVEAEAVLRLVQLRLGPLGKVSPLRDGRRTLNTRNRNEDPQQLPILNLAAGALGNTIQKLGDRLFYRGDAATLPEIVTAARRQGAEIKYPGIDPIDAALRGGPSRADGATRRRKAFIWREGLR